MGHKLVLEGLDEVQEYWKESARFDAWMRILENTIDGRGRFGTMVGMSEELKKSGTLDSHLIEYVVSIIFYALCYAYGTPKGLNSLVTIVFIFILFSSFRM